MAEARRRSRRGRVSGARRARRCCGAAGRRCLTTVGRDRQGAAKTEESAVQQTRRMPRPFPTLAPRPAGTRRGNKNAAEGPQPQKRSSKATAAERPTQQMRRSEKSGRGPRQQKFRSMATATAKPPPQPQGQHCRSRATAAKKMRGRSCMVGLSDLCRKLSGGVGWD